MPREKGFTPILFLILIFIFVSVFFLSKQKTEIPVKPFHSPAAYKFPYRIPVISKNDSYRIIIVGDSIVGSLGPNANNLREDLKAYYPGSEFVNYNYGFPSTNITSLFPRLTESTESGGQKYQAILTQQFEMIIIESFGNNPLSDYPTAEGLKKQNEELEKSIAAILRERPNAALAFMTPIALDPLTYAKSTRNLSPQVRKSWVDERVAYIDNHRKYAEERGIPVIDVYKASLKADGTVDRKYISDDFVHPSQKGIELICKTIADYIYSNMIFPQ
jgi:lysophospholipase L1-like esterase